MAIGRQREPCGVGIGFQQRLPPAAHKQLGVTCGAETHHKRVPVAHTVVWPEVGVATTRHEWPIEVQPAGRGFLAASFRANQGWAQGSLEPVHDLRSVLAAPALRLPLLHDSTGHFSGCGVVWLTCAAFSWFDQNVNVRCRPCTPGSFCWGQVFSVVS